MLQELTKVIEYLLFGAISGFVSLVVWMVRTQLKTTKMLDNLNLKMDSNQLLEEQHNQFLKLQIEENKRKIEKGEHVLTNISNRVSVLERRQENE